VRFDLIVRGGRIVSPEGIEEADIGIQGETIREIGDLSRADAAEALDAKGLSVLPGIVDSHVHLREPGAQHKEDFETGTRAAVAGGVTTVFDMPNNLPPAISAEVLQDKAKRLEGRAWCDVGFYLGASHDNLHELADLEKLPFVCGVKMFMGSSTGNLLIEDEPTQRAVLQAGHKPVAVHAEDEARLRERKSLMSPHPGVKEHSFLRDEECARLAVERIVRLSAETKRRVHVLHVSTEEETHVLERAKANGYRVTAEATPHHLFLSTPEAYQKHGALAQVNPPLRTSWHVQAIRRALHEGLFDTVGSDHAPHTFDEKMRPYPASPSGFPGVQTLLPVLTTLAVRDNAIPLTLLPELLGANPARIFGLKGKGRIAVGMLADLCLFDPNLNRLVTAEMIRSKAKWSPFVGERLFGWTMHTVLRGRIVLRDEELVGPPSGKAAEFGDASAPPADEPDESSVEVEA
jgi:dihydroorotase